MKLGRSQLANTASSSVLSPFFPSPPSSSSFRLRLRRSCNDENFDSREVEILHAKARAVSSLFVVESFRPPSNYSVAGSYSPESTLSSFTNTPSRRPLCFLHYTPRHLSLYPLFQRNQRFIGLVSPSPCTILFLFLFLSSVFLLFFLLLPPPPLFPFFAPPFLPLLPLEAHVSLHVFSRRLSLFSAKMALHSGYSLGGPSSQSPRAAALLAAPLEPLVYLA